MQGGTFTITNGGIYGSLMSTPILNVPQSGILGMHKIQERPVAVAGKIEIRPMMYLALTYDHRIVDGKEAVTFLVGSRKRWRTPPGWCWIFEEGTNFLHGSSVGPDQLRRRARTISPRGRIESCSVALSTQLQR